MNSDTSLFNLSFGAEGNLGVAPKLVSGIPNLTLNDGHEVPLLGFGIGTARATARGGKNGYDKALVQTIIMAMKVGFRHFDGAEGYGNETELGNAIKESKIAREKLYITTKISGTKTTDTEANFSESLQKLQTTYVDLYLIHAPFFAQSKQELQKKWAEMEAIHASGRAKSIGVSNFLQEHLETILETAKVVPVVNQIEYHPYLQHEGLLDFHRTHRIATVAYGPLSPITKASPGPLDEIYSGLARKYGVSEAEVALRWCIDQGVVTLTTSDKEQRLTNYMRVADFKLTSKEVAEISKVGKQKHFRGFWNNRIAVDDRR